MSATVSGPAYVRVTVKTVNGRKTMWAIRKASNKPGLRVYQQVHEDGTREWDIREVDGVLHETTRIFVGIDADIISEKPARMSNHYGLLEVVAPE